MLEVCLEKITQEVNESDYLAVMSDETSNVANVFQMVHVAVSYTHLDVYKRQE